MLWKIIQFLSICLLSSLANGSLTAMQYSLQTPEPGKVEKDRYGFEMVYVPKGDFEMGITYQEYHDAIMTGALGNVPADQIDLVENLAAEQGVFDTYIATVPGFWMDRYEITIEQYTARMDLCMETGACSRIDLSNTPELASEPDQPQLNVTWFDAMRFCLGREARLPAEEEWEYAASGPDNLIFPWGNKVIGDILATESTYPVGSVAENMSWIGIYDLAGNAGEWIEERLKLYPGNSQNSGEIVQIESDTQRVIRGGSFRTTLIFLTTFARRSERPDSQSEIGVGFRCVRSEKNSS